MTRTISWAVHTKRRFWSSKLRSVARALAVMTGAAAGAAALVASEGEASAFCGFYVSGADAKLFADATQVVLMREGTRTALTMQNDYKGPPEKFAMVIPVPVVLAKENVKVLPMDVFDKIDRLGAPRLVEYWEYDPCSSRARALEEASSFGLIGLLNTGAGGGGSAQDLGVKVEAKFAVGEYEIVILSAKDSSGLDTWLKQEKYNIPDGAEPYLKPYVAAGMKFFVAKVDPAKVKMEDGRAALSPLRFHYDSVEFSLPVRLGLINSSGTQDLIVNILAKGKRYEVANYPNVTIPTNLDVTEGARSKFGEFYAALFDKTIERNKNAVVTEYSWDAGSCDPCPGPTLDGNDIATFGADAMPSGTNDLSAPSRGGGGGLANLGSGAAQVGKSARVKETSVVIDKPKALPAEDVKRIVHQNLSRFRACYDSGLSKNPSLAGNVTMKLTVDRSGAVSTVASTSATTLSDQGVVSCITRSAGNLSFPAPDEGGVTISFGLELTSVDASAPPSPPRQAWGGGMGFAGSYVLTRLHARYTRDALGQDLVFKEAPAIAGGREQRVNGIQSELELGARPSSVNNFQARYAIRHPWKGPITCKEPQRGYWGGPPADDAGQLQGSPAPASAQKTAFVPRGQLTLATMLSQGTIESAFSTNSPDGGVRQMPNLDGGSDTAFDASSLPDGGYYSTTKRGCVGCTAASSRADGAVGTMLALGLATALLQRRRRRHGGP